MKEVSLNKLRDVLKEVTLPKVRVKGAEHSSVVYFNIVYYGKNLVMKSQNVDSRKNEKFDVYNSKVEQFEGLNKHKDIVVITPKEIENIFEKVQETNGKITKKAVEKPILSLLNKKVAEKNGDTGSLIGFKKVTYVQAIDKYLNFGEYDVYVYAHWMEKPVKVNKLKELVSLGFEDISDLSTVAEFYVKKIK